MSDYIINKARYFVKVGHAAYAAADMYNMPRFEWPLETLGAISRAMQQMSFCRGFSRDKPLIGISYSDFLYLAEMLHFEWVLETYSQGVDTIYLRHQLDENITATVYLRAEDMLNGMPEEDFLDGFALPDVPVPEGFAGTLLYIVSQPCPDPCLRRSIYVLNQVLSAKLVKRVLAGGRLHDVIGAATRLTPQASVGNCPECGARSWDTTSALLADYSYRSDLGGKAEDENGGIVAAWLFVKGEVASKRVK